MKGFWQCGKVEVTERSGTGGNRHPPIVEYRQNMREREIYLISTTWQTGVSNQLVNIVEHLAAKDIFPSGDGGDQK